MICKKTGVIFDVIKPCAKRIPRRSESRLFFTFLKGHVATAVSDDEIECQALRLEIDIATVGSACASQSN